MIKLCYDGDLRYFKTTTLTDEEANEAFEYAFTFYKYKLCMFLCNNYNITNVDKFFTAMCKQGKSINCQRLYDIYHIVITEDHIFNSTFSNNCEFYIWLIKKVKPVNLNRTVLLSIQE